MRIVGGVLQGGRYQDQYQAVAEGLELNLDAGNPVSYPGSGTVWTDTVASRAFTLYNGPTYNASNGGAIVFDPASNQYAQGPGLDSTLSNWTVEAWLLHDATNMSPGGSPCIVTQLYAGTPINFTVGNTEDSFPNLEVGTFNGGWASTPAGTTLTTGLWYQVVGTWNGTTVSLYLNGVVASSQAWPGFVSVSGNQDIGLMRRWDNYQYWGGSLSIVRIYNSDIGAAGVEQNFLATRGRYGL